MGTGSGCPLFDFLAKLKRDDQDEFARLRALLDRTAEHGTVRNEQKLRFFKEEKVFEFKTRGGVRVMAFWDEGRVIICSHGFLKKSQKTPSGELDRAVTARTEYLGAKQRGLLREVQ
jgi:phage-related protein